jgi:hypothetical protein
MTNHLNKDQFEPDVPYIDVAKNYLRQLREDKPDLNETFSFKIAQFQIYIAKKLARHHELSDLVSAIHAERSINLGLGNR